MMATNMRLLFALFITVCATQIKGNAIELEYSAASNSAFQGSSISNRNGEQEVSASAESGGKIFTRKVRNVSTNPDLKWPNAVIPYVMDSSVEKDANLIKKVMQDIQSQTCIKFVERTNEFTHIKLFYDLGCYASTGRAGGGALRVSIGKDCGFYGSIAHLLGHVIGLHNEQSRSDRDDYLTIYWDNVERGFDFEFVKLRPEQNKIFVDFDYESIMLNGNFFSSKNDALKTMVAKNGTPLKETYEKDRLTDKDVYIINKMYDCNA